MSSIVVLFLILSITSIFASSNGRISIRTIVGPDGAKIDLNDPKAAEPPAVVVNVSSKQKTNPPHNTTQIKNETKVDEHSSFKPTEMESGALLRGVSVIVVLTTIVILYMALKTYCGKKTKNPVMVSKYGVRTRRSDIEMTPLPLDEDEEDETLFEVHNTNR